jgi:D-alanine-D-alanine ligase
MSGTPIDTDERIHLIVVFGGESAEHDVSCTTAAHVLAAADPAKYRITPIGISTDGQWAIADQAVAALASGGGRLPAQLDPTGSDVSPTPILSAASAEPSTTVVMPLLHGPMGEDGTIQGLLELTNLPYVGTGVLGSAVAMDKAMAKQVVAAAGIPQARYRAFAEHEMTPSLATTIVDDLGLPVFVKPANMGSSVGVSKASSVDELNAAIDVALSYDEVVVVEEAVVGKEIEVAVLGNQQPTAATPGEIVPGDDFYSYEDKYLADGSYAVIPARLETTPSPRRKSSQSRRTGPCGAKVCRESTSSGKILPPRSTANLDVAFCSTRSTRCRVSPRSRCSRRCGSPTE